MSPQKDKIEKWFCELDDKKRGLYFAGLLLLTFLFWHIFLEQPVVKALEARKNAAEILKQQIALFQPAGGQLAEQLKRSNISRQEREILQKKIQQIAKTTAPVNVLRTQLTGLMTHQTGIQFSGLKIAPPVPWIPLENTKHIGQYTIEIQLTGSYFDILRYLRALAGMPWYLSWFTLSYQVDRYPLAEVTVTFSLLGAGEVAA